VPERPCPVGDDLLAGYLLDVLEPPERERLERHLEGCRACVAEREALRGVSDALALDAAEQAPSPALRHSVLAQVRREASVFAAARAPESAPRPHPWPRWWPSAALAGAAAALALALVVVDPFEPGARTVPVAVEAAGARGALEVREGAGRLRVSGMPAPPAGRVYQVWVRRRGSTAPQPTDALFTVARGGAATVAVPGRLGRGDEVLVTAEPAGGSRVPTRQPVLRAVV